MPSSRGPSFSKEERFEPNDQKLLAALEARCWEILRASEHLERWKAPQVAWAVHIRAREERAHFERQAHEIAEHLRAGLKKASDFVPAYASFVGERRFDDLAALLSAARSDHPLPGATDDGEATREGAPDPDLVAAVDFERSVEKRLPVAPTPAQVDPAIQQPAAPFRVAGEVPTGLADPECARSLLNLATSAEFAGLWRAVSAASDWPKPPRPTVEAAHRHTAADRIRRSLVEHGHELGEPTEVIVAISLLLGNGRPSGGDSGRLSVQDVYRAEYNRIAQIELNLRKKAARTRRKPGARASAKTITFPKKKSSG